MKNEAGVLLSEDYRIKDRLKTYFERLMNTENNWSVVLEDDQINLGLVTEIPISYLPIHIIG